MRAGLAMKEGGVALHLRVGAFIHSLTLAAWVVELGVREKRSDTARGLACHCQRLPGVAVSQGRRVVAADARDTLADATILYQGWVVDGR